MKILEAEIQASIDKQKALSVDTLALRKVVDGIEDQIIRLRDNADSIHCQIERLTQERYLLYAELTDMQEVLYYMEINKNQQ